MDTKISEVLGISGENLTPLFICEVYFHLNRRSILLKSISEENVNSSKNSTIIYNKTYEYVKNFSKLDSKKTRNLRQFINTKIIFNNKIKSSICFEIQFIVCKIVDLMPLTFDEISILLPNFSKVLSYNNRKHILRSIFNIINV